MAARTQLNPMKIIIPFFTFLFVAAMAFAQEESPAPAESTAPTTEEKASATVETTPAASTEAAAPAEKKEETVAPAPAKSSTSAAAPTKSAAPKSAAPAAGTTGAKPASATKPATGASPAKMAPHATNPRDAENAWEGAVAKHDYATVEGYVAADFAGVSSKNKFVDRSGILSDFKGDKDTYKTAKNEKLNVKMYGSNVAVVTGRARETGTGKDGKAFDRTFLFTDTWMMRGGKWQCIASHATKIKG